MLQVIWYTWQNLPYSVQILQKQTANTHSAYEKEALENFQIKHHKIHVLDVVSLRVQLLKFQNSGPNKIVFLKETQPIHRTYTLRTEQEGQGQKIAPWVYISRIFSNLNF